MTGLKIGDWLPEGALAALRADNETWIEEAAYYHYLNRQHNRIPGNWHDDRIAALRQFDHRVEQILLGLHMKKAPPAVRIACSVIRYAALFSDHLPSAISETMPLADLPFIGTGLGFTCSIGPICKEARICELAVPQGVATIGGLIAALREQYRVRCAQNRRRRSKRGRRK